MLNGKACSPGSTSTPPPARTTNLSRWFLKRRTLHASQLHLRNVTRIDLSQPDGFKRLCCRLLNIPPAQKPPIRTSLAPVSLADGFFSAENGGATRQEDRPFGLRDDQETLFSNLFPVAFPATIQTASLSLKRKVKILDHFSAIWTAAKGVGNPPVDYWVENRVLYTFRPFTDKFWQSIIAARAIRPLPPKPASSLANSKVMADKNLFIKLLNRCLAQLCASHEMAHKLGWSKEMRCYLFVAAPGKKRGRIKVKAIAKRGQREVYKAIRDKLSSDPDAIQHWQHQAFRHFFVRFANRCVLPDSFHSGLSPQTAREHQADGRRHPVRT